MIGQSFFGGQKEVTRRRRTSEYKWELYGEVKMWLLIRIQVMRMLLYNTLCPLIGTCFQMLCKPIISCCASLSTRIAKEEV